MSSRANLKKYDSAEFNVNTGQTDYNVDTQQSASFSNVPVWARTSLRTNVTISIKLNATTNPSITVTAIDSPFQIDWQEVTNIFITNSSGSTAAIKLIGTE